jgi:hypothetical protein
MLLKHWVVASLKKFLSSYDHFNRYLHLDTSSGESVVVETTEKPEASQRMRGLFVEESGVSLGMYASSAGPVVFVGQKHYLCRVGKASAATKAQGSEKRRFLLRIDGKEVFATLYNSRSGIDTNPYDKDLADVDLFALIEKNLATPSFFDNYVDQDVAPPLTP